MRRDLEGGSHGLCEGHVLALHGETDWIQELQSC
jgi:hypothetical protein